MVRARTIRDILRRSYTHAATIETHATTAPRHFHHAPRHATRAQYTYENIDGLNGQEILTNQQNVYGAYVKRHGGVQTFTIIVLCYARFAVMSRHAAAALRAAMVRNLSNGTLARRCLTPAPHMRFSACRVHYFRRRYDTTDPQKYVFHEPRRYDPHGRRWCCARRANRTA